MSNNNQNVQTTNGTSTAWQIVGRLITAAIVLAITAFFTPGFQISNFWSLAVAAVVLTIIDYLVSKFTGIQARPFGKGLKRIFVFLSMPCPYHVSFNPKSGVILLS